MKDENGEKDRRRFIAKAKSANVCAVISGGLVFLAAWTEGIPLTHWLFGNAVSLGAVISALASLVLLWYLLFRGKTKVTLRMLAGFQVTMILLAATYPHFPRIVLMQGGEYLSLTENYGDEKTIQALAWALMLGSIFILPALFYLIYSFKKPATP